MENPDPGAYYKEIKWNEKKDLDKTLIKYMNKQHKDLAVIPTS